MCVKYTNNKNKNFQFSKIHDRHVCNRKLYTTLLHKFSCIQTRSWCVTLMHRSACSWQVTDDKHLYDINRVITRSFVSYNDNVSCIIDIFDIFPVKMISQYISPRNRFVISFSTYLDRVRVPLPIRHPRKRQFYWTEQSARSVNTLASTNDNWSGLNYFVRNDYRCLVTWTWHFFKRSYSFYSHNSLFRFNSFLNF